MKNIWIKIHSATTCRRDSRKAESILWRLKLSCIARPRLQYAYCHRRQHSQRSNWHFAYYTIFFSSHFRLALPATSTISISLKSSNASNQLELATLLRITSENFRSIHLVVQVSWYGEIGVTCLVNCRCLAAVARYRSAEMYHILIAHFMMFFPFLFRLSYFSHVKCIGDITDKDRVKPAWVRLLQR